MGSSLLFIRNDERADSKYRVLLNLIPVGEENAVSMRSLSRILCVSPRAIRRIIEKARIDGNVIASSEKGYYIPSTLPELQKYINVANARIRTGNATLKAVRKLIGEVNDYDYYDSILPD